MKNEIRKLAENWLPDAISIRRHLHKNPELSFVEFETSQFISEKLTEYGISHTKNWAKTGIVATIEGRNPNRKTVALRADFDALPILEANEVDYKSKNAGVMHACGHDVHTASLLTTARILQHFREKIDGSVRLIFQPGEEKHPGGASILIKEGVLEKPKPTAIFGQHVHPSLPAGQIGLREGFFMASADEIYLSIKGRGGHGAMPQDCIDPIVVAAQIISNLQTLVSRMADPAVPSVLTFGKINSVGGATNVIPSEVKIEGTFRTMHEKWRSDAHKRIKKMAELTARSLNAVCEVTILRGYPMLFNDPDLTKKVRSAAVDFLGKSNVHDLPIRMTAEDFAFYAQKIPACFYRLGTSSADGKRFRSPVHTPTFDVDESVFVTSAGLMAWLVLRGEK
jgi:amidohydrolase